MMILVLTHQIYSASNSIGNKNNNMTLVFIQHDQCQGSTIIDEHVCLKTEEIKEKIYHFESFNNNNYLVCSHVLIRTLFL